LLSGSICVAGEGAYRAEKVGSEAFAQSTAAQARRYSYSASPLTRVIDFLIQILSYTAVALCLLYVLVWVLRGAPTTLAEEQELVRSIAATITSMVPQGLVLMATISFTIGAVYVSMRGAVVQRLHAVEAMAAVDVVCTDKTGTLTTNRLRLDRFRFLAADLSEDEVRRRLQLFASASVDQRNKNVLALRTALGQAQVELL